MYVVCTCPVMYTCRHVVLCFIEDPSVYCLSPAPPVWVWGHLYSLRDENVRVGAPEGLQKGRKACSLNAGLLVVGVRPIS